MALASILYTNGSLKPIDVDKAIAAHNALTGLTEPSEAQADWLCSIRRIFIPPSHRPANYAPADGYDDLPPIVSHLTHEGRLQGKSEMLPTGDR